jgi:hypothetical protein
VRLYIAGVVVTHDRRIGSRVAKFSLERKKNVCDKKVWQSCGFPVVLNLKYLQVTDGRLNLDTGKNIF